MRFLIVLSTSLWFAQATVRAQAKPDPQMRGMRLTQPEADALEKTLEQQPDELEARSILAAYYMLNGFNSTKAAERHATHVLWIIKEHPDAPIAGKPACWLDRDLDTGAYSKAATLWEEQVKANPQDARVLGNAALFLLRSESDKAESYLTKARALEPENPEWPEKLGHLFALRSRKMSETDIEAAKKSLDAYETALGKTAGLKRYYMLADVAKLAVRAKAFDKARAYATELLSSAVEGLPDWNYGNAVHFGNLVLGHVALEEGRIAAAEEHLILAGETPGSPQLNSFGPNMSLALGLLKHGQKETVIEYLKLCRAFWKKKRLDTWIAQIERGETPDFGVNLDY